ncbi:MAG: peptidoglycan DD-metalloendopeptidase family protein [Balneolales bacterium]
MNKKYNPDFIVIIFLIGMAITNCDKEKHNSSIEPIESKVVMTNTELTEEVSVPEEPVYDSFGFDVDSFKVVEQKIKKNETLSLILQRHGIGYSQIHKISQASQGVFNLKRMAVGKSLFIYTPTASPEDPSFLVYERDPINYVVFDLKEAVITLQERDIDMKIQLVEGVITSSLYESFLDQEADPRLAYALADVFAWEIDFYRIQKGDSFRVAFEERFVDGVSAGLGRIQAADFIHRGKEFNALYFEQNGKSDYFDKEGNSLRKAFLRAPLDYSRISSRFSNNRKHPILKTNRPHHGTDYAAPTGTPIRAVGDGKIVHAAYDRNNGNYIKIRHNSTYETGYLHMSRLANGMRKGTNVTQGQIIGFVGSTGLATGPHLCFRFWQNSRAVDPYRIDYPSSNPVQDEFADEFKVHKASLIALFDPEPEIEIEEAKDETSGHQWHLASVNLQPLVLAL